MKRVQDMTDDEVTILLLDAEDAGYQRALREYGLGGYDGLLSVRAAAPQRRTLPERARKALGWS